MIGGKRYTLVWYLDDNNMSHIDANMVTNISNILKDIFGDIVISRRSKYSFLCLNILIRYGSIVEIEKKYIL